MNNNINKIPGNIFMSEWVDINKDLPEENQDVLVYTNDNSYGVMYFRRLRERKYERKPYKPYWYLSEGESDELNLTLYPLFWKRFTGIDNKKT